MQKFARNEKSCSKYEKLPKSCRATCGKSYNLLVTFISEDLDIPEDLRVFSDIVLSSPDVNLLELRYNLDSHICLILVI